MSDRWTDRLSEYLDGELSGAEQRELDAHLAACDECAVTLAQLRQVVARAQALEDRPPATDLWAGISQRIGAAAVSEFAAKRRDKSTRLHQRRLSFSLLQLAAASIALMMVSGGTAWLASRASGPAGDGAGLSTAVETPFAVLQPMPALAVGYDAAIADLERVISERRDQLDTATVRLIEQNLLTIDRAITQAQQALSRDPASTYLNEHLTATMQQKLNFLRQAARMAGAVS